MNTTKEITSIHAYHLLSVWQNRAQAIDRNLHILMAIK